VCIIDTEGSFRSGRTNISILCPFVLCNFSSYEWRALNENVLTLMSYYCTEKLEAIAERFGVAGKDILENVVHARPFNTDMLLRLLQDLKAMLVDQGPYSLIIIDSITSLFRTEFQGRGELSMRQQVLGSL
jgi:RecA/RadA recombinase